MQRFFFHLHECGDVTSDEIGLERASFDDARQEAIRAARDVMCGEVAQGRLCLGCHIEVTDESGEALLVVPFDEAVVVSGYRGRGASV